MTRAGIWRVWTAAALVLAGGASRRAHADVQASGSVGEEARAFVKRAPFAGQSPERAQPTFAAEGKVSWDPSRDVGCQLDLYGRYDGVDHGRSLVDLQAGKCHARGSNWSVSLGYDVESWGVLEFQNPADVLNQRDLLYDIAGKRKRGIPMGRIGLTTDAGTVVVYGLVGFEPLAFPSDAGRLRPALTVDKDATSYSSALKTFHPEAAVRYQKSIDAVQIGASYFYGYRRDPQVGVAEAANGTPYLFASYSLEHQASAELQWTLGALLAKGEAALRLEEKGTYASYAAGGGLEYDLGALLRDGRTLSLLAEYDYDTRPRTLVVPFTNDLLYGVRFGLNDVRNTEFTLWSDVAFPERRVEIVAADASTRILDTLRGGVGLRVMPARGGPFADLAHDEYVSLQLTSYF